MNRRVRYNQAAFLKTAILCSAWLWVLMTGCGERGGSGDTDQTELEEVVLTCEPGARRCLSLYEVEQCTLDGARWYLYRICEGGEVCFEGECVPNESEPEIDEVEVEEDLDVVDDEPEEELEEDFEEFAEADSAEEFEGTENVIEEEWEPFEEWETSPCPDRPDMVWVGSYFCIDKYENILSFNSACEEPLLIDNDHLPSGFPLCVGCTEHGDCWESCSAADRETQTVPLYACSLANQYPARRPTFFQARQACKNVGKRICTLNEWLASCSGKFLERNFPYGDEYAYGVCVDSGSGDSPERRLRTVPTGSFKDCQTPEGVFDLAGNIGEHAADTFYEEFVVLGSRYNSDLRYGMEEMGCWAEEFNVYWSDVQGGGSLAGVRCCLGQ